MKLLLFCLFASFALAGAGENSNPAIPSEATMNRLLKLYRDFGLPIPPPDAPLIRVPTGWQRFINEKETVPIYTLGFLLSPSNEKHPAEILVGPCKSTFTPTKKHEGFEPVKPEDVRVDELGFDLVSGFGLEFPLNVGPALALQCFHRGHMELAEKLLAASSKGIRGSGPVAVSSGGPWMRHRPDVANPGRPGDPSEVLLGGTAWSFWLNELMKPGSDWKTISERLVKIVTEIPALNDAPRKELLESLSAALQPTDSRPGSVDAAIDDLIHYTGSTSQPDSHQNKPESSFEKLTLMGFEAVPSLIAHLEDTRLTRSLMAGFNNFPTMPRRVSELVSDLLGNLMGGNHNDDWLSRQLGKPRAKESVEKWWSDVQQLGEEKYLLDNVLPKTSGDTLFPQATHLLIIEKRYPKHLPSIYEKVLGAKGKIESWAVCEALARSELPLIQKLELFKSGAQQKVLALQKPALHQLRKLDPNAADATLSTILDVLPKKTKGPVWTSSEAGVSHLVMESTSERVWLAFASAIKRSEVSLRLELLNPLDYTYVAERQLTERIRLLAKFLDDSAERILKNDEKMYEGPCAAFTFPRITVRNFAAMQLASLLKLDDEPEPAWSEKKWTALRERVRDEVKKRAP